MSLQAWARALAGRPWRWGETDCASVARAGLRVFLGSDPLAGAPAWRSYREARAALPAFRALEGRARHLRLSFAEPGDLLVEPAGGLPGLPGFGVVTGRTSYLTSVYRRSVVRVPLAAARGPAYLLRLAP